MRKILFVLIIALAVIDISSAEDMVKYNDPIAKDLSNLTLKEISAIFAGDGSWFADGGIAVGTASQRGVLDIGDSGRPLVNASKRAFVGQRVNENDTRVM